MLLVCLKYQNLNLDKNYPKRLNYPNFGYLTLASKPETLERRSKAQKTCISA